MRSPLLLATTLTVLLVSACGPTDPTADGAAPTTTNAVVTTTSGPEPQSDEPASPTTTPDGGTTPTQPSEPPGSSSPPTTVPRTTVAPAPTTLPSPLPTDTENITIDDGSFESVAELGDAASLVVAGDVVAVTSLGRPFDDGDSNANTNEFVAITVKIGETLKGEATGEIVIPWQSSATDASGNRTARLLTNGIRTPDVADRLVLFLNPADPATAAAIGGGLTHQLVKLDGIAFLDGDRVVAGEVGSTAAELLLTMTVSEIRTAIAS